MKNPAITSAIDSHGKTPVGRVGFGKNRRRIGKQFLRNENSKAKRISLGENCYHIQQSFQNDKIRIKKYLTPNTTFMLWYYQIYLQQNN
jgi:hypothetical protein